MFTKRCYLIALAPFVWIVLVSASSPITKQNIIIGIDGGTESIRACCFDALTGKVIGTSYAVPYETTHPKPGWAEQNPLDWYENLGSAVRGAVSTIPKSLRDNICALSVDTTSCSVVALDEKYQPLRPCLLWMDQRAGKSGEFPSLLRYEKPKTHKYFF